MCHLPSRMVPAGSPDEVIGYRYSFWQEALQPSPSFVFPSSHCSPFVTIQLPQAVTVQLLSQPSPLVVLPSSHASSPSTCVLPQTPTAPLPELPTPAVDTSALEAFATVVPLASVELFAVAVAGFPPAPGPVPLEEDCELDPPPPASTSNETNAKQPLRPFVAAIASVIVSEGPARTARVYHERLRRHPARRSSC
jgi:hypothetical protein